MNNHKGFTLVEVIVAMTITMLMLIAIHGVINVSQRSTSGIERKVMAQQDEKTALDLMEMEIRMASFNPNFITDASLWLAPANCFSPTANPTFKGIQLADASNITVEMDINESSAIMDATNEIISYQYDVANQRITRGTNCGAQEPILGGTLAGQKTVRVINNTLGLPVFRYFNGAGVETANIPDIRRIDIALAVETEYPNPTTNQPTRMIYSTSVIVRNHAPAQ